MVAGKVLGIAVGATSVHAVLRDRRGIRWAGTATYAETTELEEVISRLAGDCAFPVRIARIALERDVVQFRTVLPAPPLKLAAVRRYVALEAPRLFRTNGAPLVTDAILVTAPGHGRALLAAATCESLLHAILAGCAQVGLRVTALAPASAVLPFALASPPTVEDVTLRTNGTTEVLSTGPGGPWRSRLVKGNGDPGVPWAGSLDAIGEQASDFASAFAVTTSVPHLELWPPDARANRARHVRRRMIRLAGAALASWALAASVYVGRVVATLHSTTSYLTAVAPALDSAMALRRELDAGRTTLETIAAARASRSQTLVVLAGLTKALDDSVVLLSFTASADGTVRVAGLAPSSARVLAQLERLPSLVQPRLEGPVTREAVAGSVRDRFAIAAHAEKRE